jgi:hypothetical protein
MNLHGKNYVYFRFLKESKYFKKSWYGNKHNNYTIKNKYNFKLAENFLHYIKNEKQTDMNENEIDDSKLIVYV